MRDGRVLLKAEHIPDDDTELYFKAADVLVLPYRHIYQSGVLFLSYSFGLPVLASDLDALKDQIIEGETGFVFRSEDPVDLAATIERYFASDLFANLKVRRQAIQAIAAERHSWEVVGRMTMEGLRKPTSNGPFHCTAERHGIGGFSEYAEPFVKPGPSMPSERVWPRRRSLDRSFGAPRCP